VTNNFTYYFFTYGIKKQQTKYFYCSFAFSKIKTTKLASPKKISILTHSKMKNLIITSLVSFAFFTLPQQLKSPNQDLK
jgi:predicted membrane channel-forming protein YqfA (hemolysin III family)